MSGQKPDQENVRKVAEALLRSEVAKAVERHLPETKAQTESSEAKLSITYADRFISARDTPLLKFGLGPTADEWARVRHAASELQEALKALRVDGVTEMTWNAPLWWDDKKPLPMEGMFVAEALKLTSQEMERRWARRPKAGKKRNWQAAAIAKVAREIWAEEEWRTHPDKYGPDIFLNYLYVLGLPEPEMNSALRKRAEYERHKQEYSTRCEKHDAPGPFGRFLNDVMQTLNVQGSAATALNSLKEAEKQLSQRK